MPKFILNTLQSVWFHQILVIFGQLLNATDELFALKTTVSLATLTTGAGTVRFACKRPKIGVESVIARAKMTGFSIFAVMVFVWVIITILTAMMSDGSRI